MLTSFAGTSPCWFEGDGLKLRELDDVPLDLLIFKPSDVLG